MSGMNRTAKAGVLRPGPGWTCLGGPVWEHTSGTRVHWSGPIVRLPDMSMPPVYLGMRLNTVIRANGGNRKRGVMAYALTLLSQKTPRLLRTRRSGPQSLDGMDDAATNKG